MNGKFDHYNLCFLSDRVEMANKSMKDCFWRIMCAIMVVFFTLASVVQHNDPDWFLWIPVYALPAFISFLQVIRLRIRETPEFQVVVKFALLIYCILDIKLFAQLISRDETSTESQSREEAQHVNAAVTSLNETSVVLAPSDSILATEEGREFFGSLIITVWLVLCCMQFTQVKDLTLGCRLLITSFVLLPLVLWAAHFYYGIDLC